MVNSSDNRLYFLRLALMPARKFLVLCCTTPKTCPSITKNGFQILQQLQRPTWKEHRPSLIAAPSLPLSQSSKKDSIQYNMQFLGQKLSVESYSQAQILHYSLLDSCQKKNAASILQNRYRTQDVTYLKDIATLNQFRNTFRSIIQVYDVQ